MRGVDAAHRRQGTEALVTCVDRKARAGKTRSQARRVFAKELPCGVMAGGEHERHNGHMVDIGAA